MSRSDQTDAQAYSQACMKKLIGKKITGAILDHDGEMWGFRVENKNGDSLLVWVLCDPEGNGPGFLEVI